MKRPENRLSKFESYCYEWLSKFGLTSWTVDFAYGTEKDTKANVCYNTISRHATFHLSRIQSKDDELRLTALHEVWHLLLADISWMAEEQVAGKLVIREEHKIIAMVENFIVQHGG